MHGSMRWRRDRSGMQPAHAADAGNGKVLAEAHNCAACHGANLNKPVSPEYPKLAGQHADYLYWALRQYQMGNGNPHFGRNNAIMQAQVQSLSQSDMKDSRRISNRWTAIWCEEVSVAGSRSAVVLIGHKQTPRLSIAGCFVFDQRLVLGARPSVARRAPFDQRKIGVGVRRGAGALRFPDGLAEAFHDRVLRVVGRAEPGGEPLVRARGCRAADRSTAAR